MVRADTTTISALQATATPLVLIGMEDERLAERTKSTVVIRNDNEDIGAFAARHFLSLGKFESFGFVTTNTDESWSTLRSRGFRNVLDASGFANPNHLKNLFKRHFGVSMRDYRNARPA